MNDSSTLHGAYEISADPARIDAARVHHWLSTDAYWALGRSRAKQDAAIAGSLNFGAYDVSSGEQVAYARVVTDRATFAWLCDVYVSPAARGGGLGTALVDAVRAHLEPFGLRRILLATADAHGLYEKAGFKALDAPQDWMALGSQ
ncbi:GNAT family N-acetyltransferase [Streptomyces sp. NPDC018059]|uniref:GNAT family N-acetyltransferase n=1 Tax=Streptomyces sp. NPDC018059 TaxID=3365041 RepID=UPI0037A9EF75